METGVDAPAEAVAAITGLAIGVPLPVPIRTSLKLVQDEQMLSVSSTASTTNLIPFAFKAIRLVYDRESGNLVAKHLDKGDRPARRGHGSSSTKFDKFYNMADFFENDENGDLVFECPDMELI